MNLYLTEAIADAHKIFEVTLVHALAGTISFSGMESDQPRVYDEMLLPPGPLWQRQPAERHSSWKIVCEDMGGKYP